MTTLEREFVAGFALAVWTKRHGGNWTQNIDYQTVLYRWVRTKYFGSDADSLADWVFSEKVYDGLP